MNIGEVITGPFKDPQWTGKLIKASLLTFLVCLTVIGIFFAIPNLIGWSKLVTQNRLKGDDTLPEFNFGNVGEGWRIIGGHFVFGAIVFVLVLGVQIVFGLIGWLLSKTGIAALAIIPSILALLIVLAIAFVATLVSPILRARIVIDGDTMAGTRIGEAFAIMRANIGTCFMFFVAIFCAQLLLSVVSAIPLLGALAMICGGIGYSAAAQGIALAQFRQTRVA